MAREPHVAGVVLAAGMACRFGDLKIAAPVGGVPMVRRPVDAAFDAALDPVIVVVGPHGAGAASLLGGTRARVATNPSAALGRGTSVSVGAQCCPADADAVVFLLADMPFVTPNHIRRLVRAWRAGAGTIVRLVHGSTPSHPVLFDGQYLPALRALDADEGGRTIIERHASELACVAVADPVSLLDVDTPEDLVAAESAWRRRTARR